MTKPEFLKELIDLAFLFFEEQDSDLEWSEFSDFLSNRYQEVSNNDQQSTSAADELGIQLVLLNRYAKEYVKIALEDSNLTTADEFSFLITLFTTGSHIKSELIHKMLLSKTSGTEVIKRLLQKGFINEYDDLEDKRSKRLEINEKGKTELFQVLPRISISSELIKGNLSHQELHALNKLLKKLVKHHKDVFKEQSKEDIYRHWEKPE